MIDIYRFMDSFLNYTILDNSIEAYLSVLGVVLVIFIIKRVISRFLASKLLGIITHVHASHKKKAFLSLVIKPIEKFILIFIIYTSLDRLNFPNALKFRFYHDNLTTEKLVSSIGIIILVTVFIQLCIRVLEFIAHILHEKADLTEDKTDNQLIVFFNDFFKVILIIFGILLVLKLAFDKDISSLLTGLSIVGAALALSMRESLENLIASFIIFFDKPFGTGDLVKVQGFTGTVEKIGLRSTRIRTEQKTFITVPNKQMVDTIIDNISLRTQRKVELRLEIQLKTSADALTTFSASVRQLLQQKADIETSYVYLMETGRNAHVVAIDYFTGFPQAIESFYALRETINLEIIQLMETQGIKLAAVSGNIDIVLQKQD
jgi:MscS family membrane protein